MAAGPSRAIRGLVKGKLDGPPAQNGFTATASVATGKMRIGFIKDGVETGSTEIDIKEAGSVAALLLYTAKNVHDLAGKPPPLEEVDVTHYTSVSASSVNTGPSHIPGCESLILHFGEAPLGIAVPRSTLLTFDRVGP